jgi:DTW domain-containing protein YfiP
MRTGLILFRTFVHFFISVQVFYIHRSRATSTSSVALTCFSARMAEREDAGLLSVLSESCEEDATQSRRTICSKCRKPSKVCLCSVLPAEKLRTPNVNILILQHPEEAGAAMSTVSLLQLCLVNCRVVTGRKFKRQDLPGDMVLAAEQSDRARMGIMDESTSRWQRTLLLWPSPDAQDLEQIVPSLGIRRTGPECGDSESGDGDQGHLLLVLLDGTWPSCKQMLQKSEILRGLRAVKLARPPGECLYAIRMEPSPESRSTLEAAAHSIAILERGHQPHQPHSPTLDTAAVGGEVADLHASQAGGVGEMVRDALLRVLLRMVELQCSHITNPKHRRTDAKHYRANRYNISAAAVTPLNLRGGGAAEHAARASTSTHHAADGEDEQEDVLHHPPTNVHTLGAEAREMLKTFENKCKNKTALLEHLIKTAQRIEKECVIKP